MAIAVDIPVSVIDAVQVVAIIVQALNNAGDYDGAANYVTDYEAASPIGAETQIHVAIRIGIDNGYVTVGARNFVRTFGINIQHQFAVAALLETVEHYAGAGSAVTGVANTGGESTWASAGSITASDGTRAACILGTDGLIYGSQALRASSFNFNFSGAAHGAPQPKVVGLQIRVEGRIDPSGTATVRGRVFDDDAHIPSPDINNRYIPYFAFSHTQTVEVDGDSATVSGGEEWFNYELNNLIVDLYATSGQAGTLRIDAVSAKAWVRL